MFFLTGTDEHGSKIAKAAQEAGVSHQDYVDNISQRFKLLCGALNISNSDFIRTTDTLRHWPSVKEVWLKLKENGDLYQKEYEGLYCIGCEVFVTEKDLIEGKCKIHKKEPESIKENNYFFRLSKYAGDLKALLEKQEIKIVPQSRANEMLELISQELNDVSFSRSREKLSWGIPVPDDEKQTMYVWADALTNYISALGYPSGEKFLKYWPADVHVVGKDIFKFHALIWPAMLLSLGIALPKSIFVHGFITVEGEKMSKSLGNVIDPFTLIEKYGVDATRYFFLRELPATEDGDFSFKRFEERYNSDLAGGLGNLVARVLALAIKNIPDFVVPDKAEKEFEKAVSSAKEKRGNALESYQFNEAMGSIWELIQFCDKYIDKETPWEKPEDKDVLFNLLFALNSISELIYPFLPATSDKIKQQLEARKSEPLFPRLKLSLS